MIKDFKEVIHLYYGAPCMFGIKVPGQETEFEKFTINIRVLHAVLNDLGEVKPVLRKLESMTEEEIIELFLLRGMEKPDKVKRTGIDNKFIQIEYEHLGVYGSDYQHIITMYPNQFTYLLSKHFDLFNIIDNNLAISKE